MAAAPEAMVCVRVCDGGRQRETDWQAGPRRSQVPGPRSPMGGSHQCISADESLSTGRASPGFAASRVAVVAAPRGRLRRTDRRTV